MSVADTLVELQVIRKGDIRATNRLVNAARAYVRRGMGWAWGLPENERAAINRRAEVFVRAVMNDGAAPEGEAPELFDAMAGRIDVYRQAIGPLLADRKRVEAEMRKLAKELPVWAGFGENIAGFGELGLAVIVGETGVVSCDPDGPAEDGNYPNPAKLYRRLGLAPYDGHAGKTWNIPKWRPRSLTAEEWTDFGYSGKRLAEIYSVVTEPLFRAQTAALNAGKEAPYRVIYDRRREHTAETHPDWTKGHSHSDALRVMVKELLTDLWCAWSGRERRDGRAVDRLIPRRRLPARYQVEGPAAH